MSAIKIKTLKQMRKGVIFHYAPFILHCLFPEIIREVYKFDTVYREKNLDQTLGDLSKIYEEVMGNKNIELNTDEFNKVHASTISAEFNFLFLNSHSFNKFSNFIFDRYNINPNRYDSAYPEILLIKRANHVELISDPELKLQLPKPPEKESERFIDGIQLENASAEASLYHFLVSNGKDRREIDRVDDVEQYLAKKYGDRFKSVFFEFVPFEEQVKYYNNAKLIICVHGGCQANQFFCKESSKLIEVQANGKKFELFDHISKVKNLTHIKCPENEYRKIIEVIDEHTI